MPGRRRSASRSRTRLPRCAKTKAELALTVVFPSCGNALVTRITLGGAPKEERRIEVRSARYASAASDFGRTYVIRSGGSGFPSPTESVVSRLRKLPFYLNLFPQNFLLFTYTLHQLPNAFHQFTYALHRLPNA